MSIHTGLVAIQSTALNTLINNVTKGSTGGEVIWEDVDEHTFARFAQFLYSGNYAAPSGSGGPKKASCSPRSRTGFPDAKSSGRDNGEPQAASERSSETNTSEKLKSSQSCPGGDPTNGLRTIAANRVSPTDFATPPTMNPLSAPVAGSPLFPNFRPHSSPHSVPQSGLFTPPTATSSIFGTMNASTNVSETTNPSASLSLLHRVHLLAAFLVIHKLRTQLGKLSLGKRSQTLAYPRCSCQADIKINVKCYSTQTIAPLGKSSVLGNTLFTSEVACGPIFLGHVRLYVLADKWNVASLKTSVLSKLHRSLKLFNPPLDNDYEGLVALIKYTYENTVHQQPQDQLRELLTKHIGCHKRLLAKTQWCRKLTEEHGSFGRELLSLAL